MLKKALKCCGYPEWSLREPRERSNTRQPEEHNTEGGKRGQLVVLPYAAGVSEKLCRIYKKHRVHTAFRPAVTLRNCLVAPKDKPPRDNVCGVVYKISCRDCDSTYIGETSRQLGTRLKEHKKSLTTGTLTSAVSEHSQNKGHEIDWDAVRIVEQEPLDFPRKVREALHIRRQKPQMNRDAGLELSPVYDCVLQAVSPSGKCSSV